MCSTSDISWHKKQKSYLKLVLLFKFVFAVLKLCSGKKLYTINIWKQKENKTEWVFLSYTLSLYIFSVYLLDRNVTVHISC